jgi:hypothetical protein
LAPAAGRSVFQNKQLRNGIEKPAGERGSKAGSCLGSPAFSLVLLNMPFHGVYSNEFGANWPKTGFDGVAGE